MGHLTDGHYQLVIWALIQILSLEESVYNEQTIRLSTVNFLPQTGHPLGPNELPVLIDSNIVH